MSTGDAINTGLLAAAVIGIVLTLWQVRSGARTQRAQFLKDLYSTLVSDQDIVAAYYLIEYGRFEYSPEFHNSPLEPKIDRLLGFVDLVCELHLQARLSRREIAFFRYRIMRISDDSGVRAYLDFLASFYQRVGVTKRPYNSFQKVAERFSKDSTRA